MTQNARLIVLTGFATVVGVVLFMYSSHLAWLLMAAHLFGLWQAHNEYRADYSLKQGVLKSLPHGSDWWSLTLPYAAFTFLFWWFGGWSSAAPFVLAFILLGMTLFLYVLGFSAYWLTSQWHSGPQSVVLLKLIVDFDEGLSLPADYWGAIQPHLNSEPQVLYLPWLATRQPCVGETITFSTLYGYALPLTNISHAIVAPEGNCSIVTYVSVLLPKELEPTIGLLLALADLDVQVHSERAGFGRLTNILRDAGLSATTEEYQIRNEEW